MTWFLGLFKGAWAYVAAVGAALVAVLAVHRSGKKAGANEVIVKTQEKDAENVKKSAEVEREILTTKPDAKRDRMRSKWQRD